MEPDSKLKIGDPFYSYAPDLGKITSIIDVDGQKYALGPYSDILYTYAYDSEKRVIENLFYIHGAKGAEVFYYDYSSPNKIIQKYEHIGFRDQTRTFPYDLDEYGIIIRKEYVYGDFILNHEDYGDPNKVMIVDGNLIKRFTTTSEFDLTRPNLPNPLPFFGKTDRNLIQKETNSSDGGIIEYRYAFDSNGKVIRRIAIYSIRGGKNVIVTDYGYDCQ
ncbi:MAG: hypothetical protein EOO43_21525 [Flavobacterium sp.]|nr:MAG: hypothetical protein EOO43_21525 [Flavobacterium sp.]